MTIPKKIRYPDLILRLIGSVLIAHFLNHIGRSEGFFELLTRRFYYEEMFFTLLTVFLSWTWIRAVSIYLDGKYDWTSAPLQRLFLQGIFGWILTAFFALLLTMFHWYVILNQKFSESSFFIYEFPIALTFLFFINLGYYIYFHWFRAIRKSEELEKQLLMAKQVNQKHPSESTPIYSANIMVNEGQRRISLEVSSIQYFFKEGNHIFASYEGKSYLVDDTLEQIMAELDPKKFFRANRQNIINFNFFEAFIPLEYGKLELVMKGDTTRHIVVSQKKASDFKKWIKR